MFEATKNLPPQTKINILKGVVVGQSLYYTTLMFLQYKQIKGMAKDYWRLNQQYEILAKYTNWEDPQVRHEIETLLAFREMTDPQEEDKE